jgi:hypothetical protein
LDFQCAAVSDFFYSVAPLNLSCPFQTRTVDDCTQHVAAAEKSRPLMTTMVVPLD